MSGNEIRIGKVSSIDYEKGMLQVVYNDKGKSVSAMFPCINNNNEYRMPNIGDGVLVAHLSNGSSRGVVIGTMWNKVNLPAESGKDIYRKEFSKESGKAMLHYDDESGELIIKASSIVFEHAGGKTSLASILSKLDALGETT